MRPDEVKQEGSTVREVESIPKCVVDFQNALNECTAQGYKLIVDHTFRMVPVNKEFNGK